MAERQPDSYRGAFCGRWTGRLRQVGGREARLRPVMRKMTLPHSRRISLLGAASAFILSGCTSMKPSSNQSAKEGAYESMSVPFPEKGPVTEGLADLGNTRLWFWDTGGPGEVIVFLHPGSGSAEFYPYQQASLSKAGYRVVSYTRRGQHPSEAGSDVSSHFSVDDLLGLMSFLRVDKFHAVGNALGGYIALDAAIAHPERLLSLVLACSMMGIEEPEYQRTLTALRPKAFDALPVELKELGPSYRAQNPEGVAEWKRRHDRAGTRLPIRLKSKINWATLQALKTRTLLLTGDADLWIPPALLKTVADKIPTSKMVVVADSGHGMQWEQPEAFNRALLEFFRSV